MPFITAGDPSLQVTADLIKTFDELGCHICEVGIPYSDPIADGPVIQASYTRALEKKINVDSILETLGQSSPGVSLPLVTLVSYAIVFRTGVEQYIERAIQSGTLAGPGPYSMECERLICLETRGKASYLVPSCTAALEISALLLNLCPECK